MSGRREHDDKPDIRDNGSNSTSTDDEIQKQIDDDLKRINEGLKGATVIE